jgi:Flp pilus assembly pilin Flp
MLWDLLQRITMNPLKRFFDHEAGNATEYALIISLVSIAITAGALVLGTGLKTLYQVVGVALP